MRRSTLLTGVLLLVAGSAFLPTVLRKMPDFEVYWRAGARVLAAEPLYRPEDGHYLLKYLPAFGVAIAPLALLPLNAAKVVWFYTSIAIIGGLVATSLRLLPRRQIPARVLVICTTVAMLKFFAHEVNLGQDNALMAWLVLLGFGCLARNRPWMAGLCLAGAAVAKPYAAVFLPYLWITRRWRASTALLGWLAVGLLLPAAVYGARGNITLLAGWLRTVFDSTPPNLIVQDNVSIWAMYAKWFGVGPLAFWLAFGTLTLVAAAVIVGAWKGAALETPEYLEMAVLLMVIPLASPQGWDYVLLVSTPAVMLVVNHFGDAPPPFRLAAGGALVVMAFSVFDLLGRRAYAAFMATSAITVCALVIVASLGYLRYRRIA